MPDLPTTIPEAADALRKRQISSVELTASLLERCHASQSTLAAFVTIADDLALGAARQADADFARGLDRGLLQGIPVGVKDNIATSDLPTTANSKVGERPWPTGFEATVVRKLREAGAVILGKTALDEFAVAPADDELGFVLPKNPWDTTRSPGGSSSGTAAAVAAGLILGGLGTDTGGSVRTPANRCGIAGLSQTFGRVSRRGCIPDGFAEVVIGPMARTSSGCAAILQAIAGFDPADPTTSHRQMPNYTAEMGTSLADLRIGIPREHFLDEPTLDSEVKAAILVAIDEMAAAGARLVDVAIPHVPEAQAAFRVFTAAEFIAYHEEDLSNHLELYGRWTRRAILPGIFYSGADVLQALRVRSLVKRETEQALSNVDVLVIPEKPGPAPKLAGWEYVTKMYFDPSFTNFWNFVGHPAHATCCGFTMSGLPIGLQIVGKPFDEATILGLGHAYEMMTSWHKRLPPVPWWSTG